MRSILFLLLSLPLWGDHSPQPAEHTPIRLGQDYALFFAVNDYRSMSDLGNPIQNARDIAEELATNYGFTTEVVENPTVERIESKIAEYSRKFTDGELNQRGQLLIYFSGHGVTEASNGYFMPADADEDRPQRTAVEYDWLRGQLNAIACQHILVVIDACYSISFDPMYPARPDRTFGPPGSKEKDQVLLDHENYRTRRYYTSDAEKDQTPDRSTLAYQMLLGLRTHRSYTGYLTADVLFSNYLRKASPTPGSGKFGANEPAARFLFFRSANSPDQRQRAAQDRAAYQKAKASDNCQDYRAYARSFPDGDFIEAVSQRLQQCDETYRELLAWEDAKEANTPTAYQDFIAQFPNSIYLDAAIAKRDALKPERISPPDNMILISGGTFQMGDLFQDGNKDEKPVHAVTVSSFYLGLKEVTFAEYYLYCSATGAAVPNDEGWGTGPKPVINVSWFDAANYCNWLSGEQSLTPVYDISGETVKVDWSANGYRLPTEAEWEYAARNQGQIEMWAGTSTESKLSNYANYLGSEDGYTRTAPVGLLLSNGLGLMDMSGNVSEWCWDWYLSDFYQRSLSSDPHGSTTGTKRVIRGGSWRDPPNYGRTTKRRSERPSKSFSSVGFRLARSY